MSEPNETPEPPASRGQLLLYALGCYVGAVVLFFIFYGLESSGSGARMPWWIVVIYNLGGKWLVAGIAAAIGTLCLVMALKPGGDQRE